MIQLPIVALVDPAALRCVSRDLQGSEDLVTGFFFFIYSCFCKCFCMLCEESERGFIFRMEMILACR